MLQTYLEPKSDAESLRFEAPSIPKLRIVVPEVYAILPGGKEGWSMMSLLDQALSHTERGQGNPGNVILNKTFTAELTRGMWGPTPTPKDVK